MDLNTIIDQCRDDCRGFRRFVVQSQLSQPGHTNPVVSDDPIPVIGRVLAVITCIATAMIWIWFTSPGPNYILNVATAIPAIFLGLLGHLVLEEFRRTAAVHSFRRYVPLRRSKYYVFALVFAAVAMISILFHVPLHLRFALSRSAMDALVLHVQELPDADRPATMRVGSYLIETAPARWKRSDGSLSFVLSGDPDAGFTYSRTPISGYPGGNPGVGGKLGGGWYWFSDE